MTWMILCLLGAVATGFFRHRLFRAAPGAGGSRRGNHERVFIALANVLFNPWIAGVLLSAILAAIMSTLSCQLLVCSECVDRGLLPRLPCAQRRRARAGVDRARMVIGGRAAGDLSARDPDSRVLGLVSYAWASFGAAFGPVVVFSLFWGA